MTKVYVALTTDPRRQSRRVIVGTYATADQAREHLNTHLLGWYYREYKETHTRPSLKSLVQRYERETGGHATVVSRSLVSNSKKKTSGKRGRRVTSKR